MSPPPTRRNITLRSQLRELEVVLIEADAVLELHPEKGGIRAIIMPRKGIALSAWGEDSHEAIKALHEELNRP